jgi:lipid-A-disaccharide synthase
MKYYLIAGEASGDLHAGNLMKELKKLDPHANFRFWGGDKMSAQGGEIVKHISELAFMGFKEVLLNIHTIFRNMKFCKKDILQWKPDVLILVDYPGFNLRIADFAKAQGIKVIYYISPQVWAWEESRVKQIKKTVDKMLVILPFEKDFYRKWNFDVEYVGHPLLDVILDFKTDPDFRKKHDLQNPVIALLPGSRKQEIALMLPVMLKSAEKFSNYEIVVAGAPSIEDEFYRKIIRDEKVRIIRNDTYNLLSVASAAMVTSGTATLETALFKVPEVVCYKGGRFSFWLAKKLVKVPFISLVNLIMGREVVKELIQDDFTPGKIETEIKNLLYNPEYHLKLMQDYIELREKLGEGGASERAAKFIAKQF